jgi:hypothetical protein
MRVLTIESRRRKVPGNAIRSEERMTTENNSKRKEVSKEPRN